MTEAIERIKTQKLAKEDLLVNISAAVKELLESKHLYQRVAVRTVESSRRPGIMVEFMEAASGPWIPTDVTALLQKAATGGATAKWLVQAVTFGPPDLKMFCSQCERSEAFNLVSAGNALSLSERVYQVKDDVVQVFVLSYLCQSCKNIPEVFLVRRQGLKLSLCGRAPMEHVDIPASTPKQVQRFYRGALLAYQSGETLAGNFLLRTVVEQWARYVTGKELARDADEILDSYMTSLPEDFKGRFFSMRSLYGELSNDIHGALASSELFERARMQITEHFEARRLFKLQAPQAPNKGPEADV
jgi:hypothetical protein